MGASADDRWSLTLFVSGAAPRSSRAIATVREVCDELPEGSAELTVVDAADQPGLAGAHDVVALPTLVRVSPAPARHLVDGLTDADRVRAWLRETR